jgi:hypothetical protein
LVIGAVLFDIGSVLEITPDLGVTPRREETARAAGRLA